MPGRCGGQCRGSEEAELGLYFYNARWYDPSLGRFIQPDSLVPNPRNPMDWDRYAYVRNNPINLVDPTGNTTECGLADGDYCNLINIEYSQASDWQESGLNHDEFVLAYEAYEYYSENPQTALQDAMNDSTSYFLADTYSEYVLHQFYQPFSELDVYEELDKAIAAKNLTNYWGLLSWLFAGLVFQSDKGYGGGGIGGGFNLSKLNKGEIRMLKNAGYDIHELKGNKIASKFDLYKDDKGNIYILLKGGKGEPDPINLNINNLRGR